MYLWNSCKIKIHSSITEDEDHLSLPLVCVRVIMRTEEGEDDDVDQVLVLEVE